MKEDKIYHVKGGKRLIYCSYIKIYIFMGNLRREHIDVITGAFRFFLLFSPSFINFNYITFIT